MVQLCVSLFRTFDAHYGGRRLDCFDLARAQELFCYLLLGQRRPYRREALIEMLWGDSPPRQARKYLRQLLWQLRVGLNGGDEDPERIVLVTDAEWVAISPEADILLDVTTFEEAYKQVVDISGTALTEAQEESLREAVQLYVGDLLEGWYQDWCLFERERLQNMYLLILDKLMRYAEVQGTYEAGIGYGLRALRCDPAREITYRRLMRLSYLAGDRTGALRMFARCREALRTELGVEPTKRTAALAQCIEADSQLDAPAGDWGHRAAEAGHSVPADLLRSCREMSRAINATQGQLQQTKRMLEVFLSEAYRAE